MSSTTHSCHVFLPLPLPFSPSTAISLHAATQSSLFLRSTCPNHLNLPRRTTSNTHSIPNRLNNSSFVFLSFNVTPHIHLTIILSAFSNLRTSSTFIAHVSLPYTITRCTNALYIFPFSFREAPLKVRIGKSSLNLPYQIL